MAAGEAAGAEAAERRVGLSAALIAVILWGILPIYYKALSAVGSGTVVSHRIVWSLVFVALYLAVARRFGEIREILQSPSQTLRLCLSGAVIFITWALFIWAVEVGRVFDVSFGYFITPLVSILIGVVVLGERLNRLQTIAVVIAALGVALQGVALGKLPWIGLTLAISFAAYGYLRKTIPVKAMSGLLVETLVTAPLALGYLVWIETTAGGALPLVDRPFIALLLIGSGVMTAIPLVLFAAGARRLPLTSLGILQYIVPSLHFLMALLVFGEVLPVWRLATFALIWLSLVIYSFDLILRARRDRLKEVTALRRQSQPVR